MAKRRRVLSQRPPRLRGERACSPSPAVRQRPSSCKKGCPQPSSRRGRWRSSPQRRAGCPSTQAA
eukprot:2360128-Pyramimonas_sp.AAC.1